MCPPALHPARSAHPAACSHERDMPLVTTRGACRHVILLDRALAAGVEPVITVRETCAWRRGDRARFHCSRAPVRRAPVRRARAALRARHAARAAVPRGARAGGLRDGLLLGRGAQVLGGRRACTRPRSATRAASRPTPPTKRCARGRTGHTEVVLVVFDPKPRRATTHAARLLGEPRPDAGHAPGQRRRHAVPLGDLHVRRRAGARGRGVARDVPGAAAGIGLRRHHDRDRGRPAVLSTPRTTTSSTSPRTRAATAASAAPA